jgi:hypothetical protein
MGEWVPPCDGSRMFERIICRELDIAKINVARRMLARDARADGRQSCYNRSVASAILHI